MKKEKLNEVLEITKTLRRIHADAPEFDGLLQKSIDVAKEAEGDGLYWFDIRDICWNAVRINRDVTLEQVLESMKVLGWEEPKHEAE